MEVRAYPKVNIGLYVSKIRDDGYHNIMSIFQKVYSVFDTLYVTLTPAKCNSITVKGLEKFVEEKESSVYKAAKLWLEEQKETFTIDISVDKKIKVQTGLGTPSSCAASTLLALDMLGKNKMTYRQLMELGAKVGSDVPFFIMPCDAAVVSSRGEIVNPIKAREDLNIELIFSDNEKVSTKEAYQKLDERKVINDLPSEDELISMYNKPVCEWNFRNDFEIVNKRPKIDPKNGKKLLLTGSGSCWFTVS